MSSSRSSLSIASGDSAQASAHGPGPVGRLVVGGASPPGHPYPQVAALGVPATPSGAAPSVISVVAVSYPVNVDLLGQSDPFSSWAEYARCFLAPERSLNTQYILGSTRPTEAGLQCPDGNSDCIFDLQKSDRPVASGRRTSTKEMPS